jgi:hypothetical protein
VVLCRDLPQHKELFQELGFNKQKTDRVLTEVQALTAND